MTLNPKQTGMCNEDSSSIKRTKSLQTLWNNKIPDSPVIDTKLLRGQLDQLERELSELREIVDELEFSGLEQSSQRKHLEDLLDVCIDLNEYNNQIAVTAGLAEVYDRNSYLIYVNNYSKVCDTEQEADETIMEYLKKGIDCRKELNRYNQWVVKDNFNNHVKKPVGFKSVVLDI